MYVWVTCSGILYNNYSIFSYSLYEITTESETYEYGKKLYTFGIKTRKTQNAHYYDAENIAKFDIFFDDMIGYDIDIENDISIYRFITRLNRGLRGLSCSKSVRASDCNSDRQRR